MRTLPRTVASIGGCLAIVAVAVVPAARGQEIPEPSGRIAFITDRAQLHVIDADGTDDTVIFGVQPDAVYGIESVAWRPDGRRLAMSSGHEALCSVWRDDLYSLAADGTDVRRVTNGPACAEMAGLPTGTVRLTIQNETTDTSEFLLRIQGLESAQGVTIQPGFQSTFEIAGVHDLGPDTPQFAVATNAETTWFDPSIYVDVRAGETVDAGTLVLGSSAYDTWGALSVSWSHDGSRLAYQQGLGSLWQVDAAAPQLDVGRPLFASEATSAIAGTGPVFSPVDDRVLYQRYDLTPSTLDIGTADSDRAGDPVTTITLSHGYDWLPDGAGFVASESTAMLDAANLVLYDLRTGAVTPITGHDQGFAVYPTVSPDGAFVAYTYSDVPLDQAETAEIRIRHLASGVERTLVANGTNPDWGP